MTELVFGRLHDICNLGQVDNNELSFKLTTEAMGLAALSEDRRRAIQELLEEIDHLNHTISELELTSGGWLTVQQVSFRLQVHVMTVYRWIRSDELSCIVLPGRPKFRVRESDLVNFVNKYYKRAS